MGKLGSGHLNLLMADGGGGTWTLGNLRRRPSISALALQRKDPGLPLSLARAKKRQFECGQHRGSIVAASSQLVGTVAQEKRKFLPSNYMEEQIQLPCLALCPNSTRSDVSYPRVLLH